MQRLGAQRLKPEHVDPETRVNLIQPHRQKWTDAGGVMAGAGKGQGNVLPLAIAAIRLKPQDARTLPLVAQHLAQARQQTVEGGQHVRLKPDGLRQAEARGKGRVGAGGADRFGRCG